MKEWEMGARATLRFMLGLPRNRDLDPKNLSITVLIPAYNEESVICDTIDSLLAQSYPIDRIILVNDCSTDNTEKVVIENFPTSVEIFKTPKNAGSKARALNAALPSVDTDLVCFVDADTVLDEFAIANIMRHFSNEKVGAVSGFVVAKNHSNFWERGRLAEYLNGCGINKSAQDNANIVMIASGCFLTAPTELIKRLGGFKERSMAEDMDLTWEIIENGYDIRQENTAYCFVSEPPNWPI